MLVGWWAAWGCRRSTWYGTYRVRTSARPFLPFTATHSLPSYRHLPSADRWPCSAPIPMRLHWPKVQPSRPKRAHSDVKLLGASPSLIGIEEQHDGTPTILSRALLTLAISRADSSCIMQHMALTSHGLHVISSSLQSLQHGHPAAGCSGRRSCRQPPCFSAQKNELPRQVPFGRPEPRTGSGMRGGGGSTAGALLGESHSLVA